MSGGAQRRPGGSERGKRSSAKLHAHRHNTCPPNPHLAHHHSSSFERRREGVLALTTHTNRDQGKGYKERERGLTCKCVISPRGACTAMTLSPSRFLHQGHLPSDYLRSVVDCIPCSRVCYSQPCVRDPHPSLLQSHQRPICRLPLTLHHFPQHPRLVPPGLPLPERFQKE